MKRFVTKYGETVYVSYIDDVDPNEGGYYCEVEKDFGDKNEIVLHVVDNFVIHREDIEGLSCDGLDSKLEELTKDYLKECKYS